MLLRSRNNDDREWSEEKMFEHRIEELNEKNAEVIMRDRMKSVLILLTRFRIS